MHSDLPQHLIDEQRSLESEIREAFKDVTREGGVSWNETEAIDGYGSEEERAEARTKDIDRSWLDLAYDDRWDAGPGIGGWSFLDAIGFRYYLPAAMIRALNAGHEAFSCHALDSVLAVTPGCSEYRLGQIQLLDEQQRRCVARLVRFMIARSQTSGHEIDAEAWREIYESYWKSTE